ncbi:DNA-binding MarR family transcriptional regulator [Rhodococcus sp. SMB37]|uniref:MarR family winged helix-turn-helix transcriptional regulator n=1 Tax=Rhodococcus sp. SMB37 TaxID=2512213 RepID=UPI0010E49ADF|nr:MarR family transcriptional regulator [Rhodococcus sp. SMB37]TCN49838.1 DNA-binding MarR family transcriptional regulator [Rhodococcus sp. SMB37]
MDKAYETAKTLMELAWWVQRKGPIRSGLEPLPAAERAVLRYLEHHDGAGVTEVGSALNMKTSNVSAVVRALSERGLVEKSSDPRDKRKSLLHRTDLARANKGRIDAAVTGALEEVLGELSPEHRESLFDSLEALSEVASRLRPYG